MSNNDLINDLLKLLADKINEIRDNDHKISDYENTIIRFNEAISRFEASPIALDLIDLPAFINYIREYIPVDDKTYPQDRVASIIKGLELPKNAIPFLHDANDFEDDELEKINDFVELLRYTLTVIDKNKLLEVERQESNPELLIYTKLYDMIRFAENGVDRFEEPEIRALLEVIKDKDYLYKLDVLERINEYNNRIQINKLKAYNADEEDDVVAVNSFDFDQFDQILTSNGLPSFASFKNYKSLAMYFNGIKFNNVINILNYLASEPKYDFLIHPAVPLSISYVKKMLGVFRYSNVNILQSLAAQDMPFAEVKDIFNISGVYRPAPKHSKPSDSTPPRPPVDNHNNDETGTYDYYINNKRYLDDLSVKFNAVRATKGLPPENLYLKVFLTNKDVLKTPNDLFKANFELLMHYDLITPETERFSVSGIHITYLKEQIDRLIECGLYDTVKKYLSTLMHSSIYVDLLTLYHQKGDLVRYINPDLSIRELRVIADNIGIGSPTHIKLQSDIINTKLDTFMNNINANILKALGDYKKQCTISTTINDFNLANMISTFELKDNSDKAKHTLVVNGVIISKDKFINNWNIISNTNEPISLDEKILLAATYGSRYSEEEIDKLLVGFIIEPKILEPQRGV